MLRMTTLRCGLWLLAVASLPAATAGGAPASAAHAARVHVIVIDKMQYGPMPTGVRAGDIVEWTNHDILEHSVTARDGSVDLDLKAGASGRFTVTAGSHTYFCKFHPTMTATLLVR
jgi:plastocyanin